jgi:hypothetical protein
MDVVAFLGAPHAGANSIRRCRYSAGRMSIHYPFVSSEVETRSRDTNG